MRPIRLVTGIALGATLALAGCGVSTTAGRGAPPASVTAGVLPVTPTASAAATNGPVTLTPDRRQYGAHDPIIVTIHNALPVPIYAATHHSECTIVTLERLVGGAWQPQANCLLEIPTGIVPIGAGSALAARLTLSPGGSWPTGSYRIALAYLTTRSQAFAGATEVDSLTSVVA